MKLYGLIGNPLGHSFSQKYFTKKFQQSNLTDCAYRNFETADISKSLPELKKPEVCGLNITIPFKQEIINYLDSSTEVVKNIQSCNCIKVLNNKWIGYNTDVIGFQQSFKRLLQPHHKRALVLGSGGSSKSVEYVLQSLGIEYLLVSRTNNGKSFISYNDLDKKIIQDHLIIVNTTPVGMFPNVNAYPKIPYEYLTPDHYLFDLIYNPQKTMFLKKGEEKGAIIKNGYEMLTIQAEESWKIWNED